jgi:hypothetical protein
VGSLLSFLVRDFHQLEAPDFAERTVNGTKQLLAADDIHDGIC